MYCEKRVPGCHSDCKEYNEYKLEIERRRQALRDIQAYSYPEIYVGYAPYRKMRSEKKK